VRKWISTGLVALGCLTLAPTAAADTRTSSNWAGYAAHRAGVSFAQVSGSWRQPSVSCIYGVPTYSAFWVGLGGFNSTAPALEQIGTEADCDASGRPVLSAWYELVPAPSTPIELPVAAGDEIDASVTVHRHRVTVSLYDATRHRGFTRTLTARSIDTSSAEWIAEAPSECNRPGSCQPLSLADFGAASFLAARAQSIRGRRGSIASPAWSSTRVELVPGGRRFLASAAGGPIPGAASPGGLRNGGTAFKVTYGRAYAARFMTVRSVAPRPGGPPVHPGP
jgi:hypothetical protein